MLAAMVTQTGRHQWLPGCSGIAAVPKMHRCSRSGCANAKRYVNSEVVVRLIAGICCVDMIMDGLYPARCISAPSAQARQAANARAQTAWHQCMQDHIEELQASLAKASAEVAEMRQKHMTLSASLQALTCTGRRMPHMDVIMSVIFLHNSTHC